MRLGPFLAVRRHGGVYAYILGKGWRVCVYVGADGVSVSVGQYIWGWP